MNRRPSPPDSPLLPPNSPLAGNCPGYAGFPLSFCPNEPIAEPVQEPTPKPAQAPTSTPDEQSQRSFRGFPLFGELPRLSPYAHFFSTSGVLIEGSFFPFPPYWSPKPPLQPNASEAPNLGVPSLPPPEVTEQGFGGILPLPPASETARTAGILAATGVGVYCLAKIIPLAIAFFFPPSAPVMIPVAVAV